MQRYALVARLGNICAIPQADTMASLLADGANATTDERPLQARAFDDWPA